MAECKTCKHKGTNTHICDECASYYSMYEKKIVTNAMRIRSMTDAELAEFIHAIDFYNDYWESEIKLGGVYIDDSKLDILEWLQSEAE